MVLSRRTRWLLFVAAVLAFAVAAYFAVWYARGYTFDPSEWRFTLTGAVTVEVNVAASVAIDGKPLDGTSLIGNTYARDNLPPGAYTLRVERDGHSSWAKTVVIEEGRVTNFSHVLLLDLDPDAASRSRATIAALRAAIASASPSPTPTGSPEPFRGITVQGGTLLRDGTPVATDVAGFSLTGDGSRVAWWTRNEVWVMWLRDTAEQPFRSAHDAEIVTRLSTPIDDVLWWPDHHHVAVASGEDVRVIEIDSRGGTNIIRLP